MKHAESLSSLNNQTGSVLIWVLLILVVGLVGGGYWMYQYQQNKLAQNLAADRVMPTEIIPSPSPDYSLAKDTYNLSDEQVEILSKVVDDEKL